jgi:hypothetical protein
MNFSYRENKQEMLFKLSQFTAAVDKKRQLKSLPGFNSHQHKLIPDLLLLACSSMHILIILLLW